MNREAMEISLSTPKLAIEHPHQGTAATPTAQRSPLIRIGHILKRCYERVCSAIFDGDGDCMRL